MSTDRVAVVEHNLDAFLEHEPPPVPRLAPDDPLRPGGTLTARRAVEISARTSFGKQEPPKPRPG